MWFECFESAAEAHFEYTQPKFSAVNETPFLLPSAAPCSAAVSPQTEMFNSTRRFGAWHKKWYQREPAALQVISHLSLSSVICAIQHLIIPASSFLHWLSDHLTCIILLYAELVNSAYLHTCRLGREGFPEPCFSAETLSS